MNKNQIASLGCKLLGIYSIIQSFPLLGNILQVFAYAKDDTFFSISLFLSALLPFIMMVALGIALFFFSNNFAQKMASKEINLASEDGLSAQEIQSIAFSVVGLVLIVIAIPKIFQIGWNIHSLQSAGDQRNTQELLIQNMSFTLATGIQFLIGIFLFIGSEILSSGWYFTIKRLKYEKNITNRST